MIKKQSDDPDVAAAANKAEQIIKEVLSQLPEAKKFDYGGHILDVGEYEVCDTCTSAIAEAQQANLALEKRAEEEQDSIVKEHIDLAARLFKLEAEVAIVRAELHNGHDTEPILNSILGFIYDRDIHDDYEHSHREGKQ